MAQLFVGVWPPAPAVRALRAYPRPEGVEGWSDEGQWLVNVRPLSFGRPGLVEELVEVLRFELDGMPPPTASFGPVKAGSWLRVPVLGLDELRDVVFETTMPIVPVNHPKSLPWEVTVPLRKDRSPKDLIAPLSASWTVEEVVLAEGTRRGGTHHYETVATIPLG
jgi:hypothetical protein